jgi:hypothetical protein
MLAPIEGRIWATFDELAAEIERANGFGLASSQMATA